MVPVAPEAQVCLTEILNFKPLIDETMEIDMTRVVWSASPTIKL